MPRFSLLLLASGILAVASLQAQTVPLEFKQEQTPYNLHSFRGVPLSTVTNVPPGSDGRAPTLQQQQEEGLVTTLPTPGQFQSALFFGGIAAPRSPQNLSEGLSFGDNAAAIQLPLARSNNAVVMVLRYAQVGAPIVSRQVSFLFGSIIPVPETDENGALLVEVRKEDYWLAEPHSLNEHEGAPYYYSPHARAVFAVQAGPVEITWRRSNPTSVGAPPSDYTPQKYWENSGSYYRIHPVRYIVSGSAVKPPRKIFWTQGVFQNVGKPVNVPTARIGAVNIVYNPAFPRRVETEYLATGQTPVIDTNRLEETRTLWFDTGQSQILAYNREGRVFLELLGDTRPDGLARVHLGFEIVDVFRQPTPSDVRIDLGEKVTAWQDGRDDSALVPEPLLQANSAPFAYRHTIPGSSLAHYYAIRETRNLNDFLVHWLEEGEVGLRWPSLFVRYEFGWPEDVSEYSHYIRPSADTDEQARQTSIQLPLNNAPLIEYQDLDQFSMPRANLTTEFRFYSRLDSTFPAHRALLRFTSSDGIAFERVFSWLDTALKSNLFTGSYATSLTAWDTNSNSLVFIDDSVAPRIVNGIVPVGTRINPPLGELGAAGGAAFWAGHIRPELGNAYNINAYRDPIELGFEEANLGSIIPVNAAPGNDRLEVWWFRKNNPELSRGFEVVYWPSVIGRYSLVWPSNTREIILASNDGSGGLASLEANGRIYTQNDKTLAGYNPNEEHALMLAGQAYALRDDLNLTEDPNTYSSEPFVLLEYTDSDSRLSMSLFRVLREKPENGIVFDYITEAGRILQAPMPLPLLAKPVEGAGASAINYNQEPPQSDGDFPTGWEEEHKDGPFGHYPSFTFRDRKEAHWVYRGLHGPIPALEAGAYVNGAFEALPAGTALTGQNFIYFIHTSRRPEAITIQPAPNTTLPSWLVINGVALMGRPGPAHVGQVNLSLEITGTEDGAKVIIPLQINVLETGAMVAQGPLTIVSSNKFIQANVTFVGRPPSLATSPEGTNSFTMRFYYKTLPGFAWPGLASPPAAGAIVPYLRAPHPSGGWVGEPASKNTPALDIVYRPVWPARTPTLRLGDTLTASKLGLAGVRGQTSVEVLYQQSIASDITVSNVSAVLHDPTREKSRDITAHQMERLPPSIKAELYQGKYYFPNLPPHLAQRVFFDPNRGSKGHLVYKGEFKDEILGEDYLQLNVLRGTDLQAVLDLCPASDTDNKNNWDAAVHALSTVLETFMENPQVPGTYIPDPDLDEIVAVGDLAEIKSSETAVDSYAMSAAGPGVGYVTYIVGNGRAHTPSGEPITIYILRVDVPQHIGELKIVESANPLSELLTIQHSADLAGRYTEYEYEWMIAPPIDGREPEITAGMEQWTPLAKGSNIPRYTIGGAGIQALSDNYLVLRYKPLSPAHPLYDQWSAWTTPQLAEGWIKRVLAGINPFNQRITDLFNNRVNTDVSLIAQAGKRWEGDIALNLENINNFGLIEIYETVLRRGRMLSIDAGINYGPANDALLLAAGYLNDLYMMLGNEAWADAANPTIGIGTKDQTYGDIATALFAFKGQVASLLEEELALLRGRDDILQPGVEVSPVYNRLIWNYTRGIDAGEVIYALNYNIQENADGDVDGVVNAEDAAKMFPQGHGDALGHYLTAVKGYYSLLLDADFDWVPRTEAVLVLGKPVQVDYLDERKFAAASAALARAGRQVFDLTWRQYYQPSRDSGWSHFEDTRTNTRRKVETTRYWGVDHWAARAGQGTYINWIVGNAILPDVDPDPNHEGIQKIDRTTVPELSELALSGGGLQTAMDNAEGGLTPLGLAEDSLAFDINPNKVLGVEPQTHFEQIYDRAKQALNNALTAFDDAKDVTRLMRSEEDSLADLRAKVAEQELAYTHKLIELYGTPYTDDIGPGRTYPTGFEGPDLLHYTYVDIAELSFQGNLLPEEPLTINIDSQVFPEAYFSSLTTDWDTVVPGKSYDNFNNTTNYANGVHYVEYTLDPHGFFGKPSQWTGRRRSPGKIQQAISDIIRKRNLVAQSLIDLDWQKTVVDKSIQFLNYRKTNHDTIRGYEKEKFIAEHTARSIEFASDLVQKTYESFGQDVEYTTDFVVEALPESMIAGLAAGGDLTSAGRAAIEAAGFTVKKTFDVIGFLTYLASKTSRFGVDTRVANIDFYDIAPAQWDEEVRKEILEIADKFSTLQGLLFPLNSRLQELDDARRAYRLLVAEGDRILEEREIFRRRAAAVIQGYRTRDAAFRIFRNEKLERYKSLYDLAAQYTFLAAKAFDYETGLLHTESGKQFINRVVKARALGVVVNGEPQYAGSNTGDPGLSSALAEMKADWLVLKGRLGFNNPDAYGTTVSLRNEHYRIFPGTEGASNWKDILLQGRKANLLDDADVRRHCMQIDPGNGLPVPGIVLQFETLVADGWNLFGQPIAPGDHFFSSSSFATKIHAVGVALEGYKGMDNPSANSSAVNFAGGNSPAEPAVTFLDPLALAATPYVYLIPVGADSMRSPPLGDQSVVRSWTVQDVTIPLPFNIGASDFSSKPMYQTSDSLTESLFGIRKHQAFRPVSSASVFTPNIFGAGGSLVPSQFTNRRLIGRSVWNSKWKLVIPGHTLLNNPNEGLDRFIQSVNDVKLHFITYSYSGN